MLPQLLQLARALSPALRAALGRTAATGAVAARAPFLVGATTTLGILSLPITYPLVTGLQFLGDKLEDKEAIERQRELDKIPLSQRNTFDKWEQEKKN